VASVSRLQKTVLIHVSYFFGRAVHQGSDTVENITVEKRHVEPQSHVEVSCISGSNYIMIVNN